jgi:hypothetical protein
MKSSSNRLGRPRSGSRQIQSATVSTAADVPRIEVRRSAEKRPMPLQNVRSASSSPNRGKASTRIRVRRTIQAPRPSNPASTRSA